MRLFALILIVLGWAAQASRAQEDASAKARAAQASLQSAVEQLQKATRARDRVQALTSTILAFEEGLTAMREGLRQAAVRERALSEKLAAKEEEISALFGTLLTMGRVDSPTVFLHPQGALGTARAGMLLAELGPALNNRTAQLRADLAETEELREVQQAAADRMSLWLSDVQEARAALNQAMAERTDLPTRFTADPTRAAVLLASSETLDAFAERLAQVETDVTAPPLSLTSSMPVGDWPLPVRGVVLRKAGETDAAGITRPGLVLATQENALVTAPAAATVRYAGPLLDFGLVVMLEPEADALIVLSGLGTAYGSAGEVIEEGSPIGLMPTQSGEFSSTRGEETGTDLSETLYIEVRQNNRPVDPATWFATGDER